MPKRPPPGYKPGADISPVLFFAAMGCLLVALVVALAVK